MADLIVLAIVGVVVASAIRYIYKAKKNGAMCVGCSGGAGCPACAAAAKARRAQAKAK